MSPSPSAENSGAKIAQAAAEWVARRDRGLSAAEQDAFLQWLQEDARHRAELARLDRTWGALDSLSEWRPAHSVQPNPDLLAREPRRTRRWVGLLGGLAAAAAVTLGVLWLKPTAEVPPAGQVAGLRVIPAPERRMLEDGSVIEANRDGVVELAFTLQERRVRLLAGEAHFSVAKDPARPFIVEVAGGVAVRAIGTAFNVRRTPQTVDVLVTEGHVQVEAAPGPGAAANPPAPTTVQAGQQATVDMAQRTNPPVVTSLSPMQISRALAWQGVRLVFDDLPLAAVVAEFNRRNRQRLEIVDPRIAGLRIAGSFRADNVEAFSRLLEASFGVAVERRADGTLLLRREG